MNENNEQPTFVSMSLQTIELFNNEVERVEKTLSDIESHKQVMNDYLEKLHQSLEIQIGYCDELQKQSRCIEVSTVGKDEVEFTAASIVSTLKHIAKFLNSVGKKPE
jgi:hypothetical protein